ncbi:transposase family protein [Aliinostoc sp. HNIBRCY26]|uniref:transposase family protein n=1 Tax=Aliinostoc sp. HNIBRCY26 TaxID=3418997 RepID=UPI003D08BAA8
MTSPLERIESHPQESKRLIGIKYEDFTSLVILAEKRHIEKQALMQKNKIRLIAAGGGRKAEMTVKEGICLCSVYLRQKPTFEILGLLFNVARSKANNTFNYWVVILREILPASQVEEVKTDSKKYQELCKILSEHELIVDSAEQAIERPGDYQEQKKYYSGKKKIHTIKNQFIVLPGGRDIVDICIGQLGKISDISLFREHRSQLDETQRFLGDKAYIGEALITTPHKKPKKSRTFPYSKRGKSTDIISTYWC